VFGAATLQHSPNLIALNQASSYQQSIPFGTQPFIDRFDELKRLYFLPHVWLISYRISQAHLKLECLPLDRVSKTETSNY
jgi:hypothetical protein